MMRLTIFFVSILLLKSSLSEGIDFFCSNSDDCARIEVWAALSKTAFASIATRGYTSQQALPTGSLQALRSASVLLEKEEVRSKLVVVVERFKHRDSDTNVCMQCCLVLLGSHLRRYCSSFENSIDHSSSQGKYESISRALYDVVRKMRYRINFRKSLQIDENLPLQVHRSMKSDLQWVHKTAEFLQMMRKQILLRLHSTDLTDVFIAGLDSSGLQLSRRLANCVGVPFIPLAQPGRLSESALTESHADEFGYTQFWELHSNLQIPIARAKRIAQKQAIVVDAFIITGETMRAACTLLERVGKSVALILTVADHPMSRDRRNAVLEGYSVATCL